MVTALYALILVPVIIYIVFTIIEISLVLRIAVRTHSRSLLFVQASTEITHTLLVFAFAQFMVTFSELLVQIGASLYWPLALFMTTLLARGSLYLLLFYREHQARWAYLILLVSYLVGLAAVIWGLMIVVRGITMANFTPYTADMPLVLGAGVPALAIFVIPALLIYSRALKKLNSHS